VTGLRFCVRAPLAGRAELTSWLLSRAGANLVRAGGWVKDRAGGPAAQRRRRRP
jgi:hypothetical protein